MRVIVLTSSMRRHQFVANAIAARMNVAGVWQERKSFEPMRYAESPQDEAVIERHFAARDDSEEHYFAGHDRVQAPSRPVPPLGCNDPVEIDEMRRIKPDVVLVFGSGLLKQPLFDAFAGTIRYMELGRSPG
jgi:hypothetical protein